MPTKHGIYSPRLVSAKAEEVRAELVAPWLSDADPALIERFCRAEARARMLNAYVMRLAGEQGVEAIPETLWGQLAGFEGTAARLAGNLGLSPAGRARLMRRAAQAGDLDQLALIVLGRHVKTSEMAPLELEFIQRRIRERTDETILALLSEDGPPPKAGA